MKRDRGKLSSSSCPDEFVKERIFLLGFVCTTDRFAHENRADESKLACNRDLIGVGIMKHNGWSYSCQSGSS